MAQPSFPTDNVPVSQQHLNQHLEHKQTSTIINDDNAKQQWIIAEMVNLQKILEKEKTVHQQS